MNKTIDPLPRHWLLGISAVVVLSIAVLTWLFTRAEAVAPEQHFSYTHHLRDLRELDAKIDGELLANRQELSRNYDALTVYTRQSLDSSAKLLDQPAFLAGGDRTLVRNAAGALQTKLQQKADLVDRFKRNHAVLRNSLAYFPVAASNFLDGETYRNAPGAIRNPLGIYARNVLIFSRLPSEDGAARITVARHRLLTAPLTGETRHAIDNIVRHGDVITHRLSDLDLLTQQIFNLSSGSSLESLNRLYAAGHVRAMTQADHYRMLLYALAVLLTTFLAFTFIRLDHTRRSLGQANREISARYVAQLAAEKMLHLHATAFHSAHDGITLTDAEGNILDVNPAFTRITGFERSETIGRNPRMLKSGRHDREFYAAMWKSIQETGSWRGEIWNRNKYGEIYPELLSISAVRDEKGKLTNFVAVFADISRLKAQEMQLTKMAYYDALTELPNRVLLADRLVQGISQTRRTQTLMATCYLDLDGFKLVNDTWGHEVGDQLLVEMAGRLKEGLRGGDTLARLGGDEFVLLLVGLESSEECCQTVQRLLSAIAQPLQVAPHPVTLSASIGITLFPLDDSDSDTLLRHADQSMYQAKQAGKNCYHIFDAEQDRHARSRYDHIARIRQAFDQSEFVLHFQPKVDMRQGTVMGAEALIRWNHPERGLLLPIEFLPLIEDNDLIRDIGDWAIHSVLVQMEQWLAGGLRLAVSVNVAGRHLQSPNFVRNLRHVLERHPRVARQLGLEVLETTALEDVAKASRVIEECREMGIYFALDDFGTGYSSLTYLKRLPAETIKIDQSFVRDILSDFNNLVIVQGVIGLASAFQRKAIAEGVETAEHGRILMQLNCDLAQGYGIARPMPANQIPDWVKNWRPDPAWQAIKHLYWDDADYPMLVAEVEHRNWIAQVAYAINEGQPVPHKFADDSQRCNFGHWYYGRGRQRYARIPAFARIEPPHNRVHEIAAAIDRHWRNGHIEDARALIPELLATRDTVLAALRELQLAVGASR
ncbi:MAG: EAL domain-containing protein [Sulfuricellaceae bacterium]|nr:EAL domain-containing protein [Sulfuricellaceae bacterium]